MIHMLSVAQLMHHHIIAHEFRCQHQQAVQIQIAGGRAASPFAFLMANRYAPVGDPHLSGEGFDAGGQVFSGRLLQGIQFFPAELRNQLRCRGTRKHARLLFQNPVGMPVQKALNLALRSQKRRPDKHRAVRANLKRQRLSAAANQLRRHQE